MTVKHLKKIVMLMVAVGFAGTALTGCVVYPEHPAYGYGYGYHHGYLER
jgi:hypothetical protein